MAAVTIDPRLIETCSAPTNIAVIKYWGKKDAKLNTPINSSTSVTLNQNDLRTVTTVAASKEFDKDRLWLNGREETVEGNKRVLAVLREMRAIAGDRIDSATGAVLVKKEEWGQYKFHIVSENNFPTAAGLASSAAGYACLVATLSKLLCTVETFPHQLTAIARQGSGSACRSLYGGFASWRMGGSAADGSDSVAVQVEPQSHWPDLQVLVLVANDRKKDTSSTEGMQRSVATSLFLQHRAAAGIAERRVSEMEDAIRRRDFATFARLTMSDSNQFHATCLDSYPPIFYMSDVSREVIQLVHRFNEAAGQAQAAYTFDAGPNAVIFVPAAHAPALLAAVLAHFPPADAATPLSAFVPNSPLTSKPAVVAAAASGDGGGRGLLKMIYHTSVGDGPRHLTLADSLLSPATGTPLKLQRVSSAPYQPSPAAAVIAVSSASQCSSKVASSSGGCCIKSLLPPLQCSLSGLALLAAGLAIGTALARRS